VAGSVVERAILEPDGLGGAVVECTVVECTVVERAILERLLVGGPVMERTVVEREVMEHDGLICLTGDRPAGAPATTVGDL